MEDEQPNSKPPVDLANMKLPLSLEVFNKINKELLSGAVKMYELPSELRDEIIRLRDEELERKWPDHFDVNY